jgi:starch synthase
MSKKLDIVHVASECFPFAKTGGLGDVVGALSKAQAKNHHVSVFLPLYKSIKKTYLPQLTFCKYFDVYLGFKKEYCGIYHLKHGDVDVFFIDNEYYFNRDEYYGHGDDGERFGFYTLAVIEAISHLQIHPNIIHAHDWQAGMLSLVYHKRYKAFPYYKNIHFIQTIHNPSFQGLFPKDVLSSIFGLGEETYKDGSVEFKNQVSYLKTGIMYSDEVTTVSPTHARELLSGIHDYGLSGCLQLRLGQFRGILNGIDYDVFNPRSDSFIAKTYVNRFDKIANKTYLQEKFNLPVDEKKIIICFIGRMSYQKGCQLIIDMIPSLLENPRIQICILGSGDQHYVDQFEHLRASYPTKVGLYIGFDEKVAHWVYAGSDYLLMPSLFEPCGSNQMIALRYLCVPIVFQTGGLNDTIQPYNEYTYEGNGFSFNLYYASTLAKIVEYAVSFYDKDHYSKIIDNGQKCDFSWTQSASEYIEIYNKCLASESNK